MKKSFETLRDQKMDDECNSQETGILFAHIMRKQGLENLAMTGKILGRKSRGRQYLDQIKEWTGIQQTEVLLRAANTRNLQTVNVN